MGSSQMQQCLLAWPPCAVLVPGCSEHLLHMLLADAAEEAAPLYGQLQFRQFGVVVWGAWFALATDPCGPAEAVAVAEPLLFVA